MNLVLMWPKFTFVEKVCVESGDVALGLLSLFFSLITGRTWPCYVIEPRAVVSLRGSWWDDFSLFFSLGPTK